MKTPRIPFFLATTAILAVSGCAMPTPGESHVEDESIGAAQQAIGDVPPGGRNGKTGRCMWDVDSLHAYRTYATAALHAGGGELPSGVAIPTDCRDEVIANMVECALRQDQVLRDPDTGTYYRGWWGLAPDWYSSALTSTSDRRWITGCMVQRLNANAVVVPILLEGAATPINTNAVLQADFPFRESIAYGDLFTPQLAPLTYPIVVNVCYNDDLERACHTAMIPVADWLTERICDSSPTCGLNIVGPCSTNCRYEGLRYPSCLDNTGDFDDHTVEVRLELANACGG